MLINLIKKQLYLCCIISLLLIVSFQNVFSSNYYWRATATNNLYTNVGNWETTPGGGITPGVAPTSTDSVFFPVTSNVTSINLNGGNSGVFTVSAPATFTFTGTGNFYGDINADSNVVFKSTVMYLKGLTVKNINIDSNPNTSAIYFISGGAIYCQSGTVNLNHNLYTNARFELASSLTQFNTNTFDLSCGNFRIGNATSAIYDLSNSEVEAKNITYYTSNAVNLLTNGTRLILNGSATNVFYGYGSAPLTFQSLTISGAGNVNCYANYITFKMDSLIIKQASAFDINNVGTGTWYIDSTLVLEKPTSFLASRNLTVNMHLNKIIAPPLCQGQSTFTNFRLHSISPITINTIAFKNITFLGTGLTSSITNDVVNNSGSAITWSPPLGGQTFHWIGNSGDWNDPTKWSLLGSGGVPQAITGCVPTYADSVVFDDNSFTNNGQIVNTVSLQAKCKSITNIDSGNEGELNGSISIAGNANFTGASAVHTIELVGKGNHRLTSGSNFTYSGAITFNAEGNYILSDSVLSSNSLSHRSGGLDFDDNNINVNYFSSSGEFRTLDFSNATIRTNTGTAMTTSKLTSFDATNSSIIVENPSGRTWFGGGVAPNLPVIQLNDVHFTANTGTGDIYSNNINVRFNDIYFNSNGIASYGGYTANTLNLTAGKTYSFLPRAGWRFNILTGIITTVTSCNDLAVLKSTTTDQVDFYKTSLPFTTDGLLTQGINATGATLTVNNGVDLGNNTNVVIGPGIGRDMYWVNDGGNWDDGFGHWSIGTSGGDPAITNPSGCIPRPIDNVFFDTNSFTGMSEIVTLNIDANCNNITWDTNAASFSPVLAGANTINLDVYGSIKLSNGMIHNHTGKTNFRGVLQAVNSQTINTDNVLLKTQMYFLGGGRYDITSTLRGSTNSRFFFNSGHLYTNGNDITVGIMYLELPTTNSADISNSTINLTVYTGYRANHYSTTNFNATGSSITVPQFFYPNVWVAFTDTIQYNDVRITGGGSLSNGRVIGSPVSFNKVSFGDNNNMRGTFIFDTLIYSKSTINTFNPTGFYSILDTLIANGTPCLPITLRSSATNTPANISSISCNFDIQFGSLQDLTADIGSGCTPLGYRVFGNDAGGNSNFNFVPPPSTNQLGSDSIVYCTNSPYTINTDGFGNAPATYLWNTGDTTKTIEVDSAGTYFVTVTYSTGCSATDSVNISIIDTVPPMFNCKPDTTIYLDNNCQYVINDFTDSIAIDDCSLDSTIITTQNPTIGSIVYGAGISTVWIYAEDNYGNIDSCSFQLTLLDTVNPIITCNDTTIYLNATGEFKIDTSFILSTANDNCGVDSIWTNDTLFTCANIGNNSATIYTLDINGNIDSCVAIVTVLDTVNPIITCNDTTIYLNANGEFKIDTSFIFSTANDNCGVDSIWTNDTLFTCANIGNNSATIYILDINGNLDSCAAIVTVLDTVNPIITCNDTTIYLNGTGEFKIDTGFILSTANDNCGVDSIWTNDTIFTCANIGNNSATIYILDINGNLDSCLANVTVLDTVNPTITCLDTTIYLNATGEFKIDTGFILSTANDNCGVDTIWTNDTLFNCANIGNNSATIYILDINGNLDSCLANVTVLDTLNPIITCNDTTIYLNASGEFKIDTSFIFSTANDNCGVDSIWTNDTIFTCVNTGNNSATIYILDINGNIDSCLASIVVLDTVTPSIVCKDTTIYLSTAGNFSIDTSHVFINASDNCGVDSIWISNNNFTCSDTGINIVKIYVRDVNSNIDSCISNVTVLDTIPPMISCKDTIVYLNNSGQTTIDTSFVYNSSFAGCGLDSIWIVNNIFTCINTGANQVWVYARDINNNMDSCLSTVTVFDTINPSINCKDTIIYLDINGQFTIDTSYVHIGSNDNCGVDSIWMNNTTYNCNTLGVNTVNIFIKDVNGNIDSCSALITVLDTISPTIICKDTIIYLSTSGQVTIDTSFITTTTNDNCNIGSVWINNSTFNCNNIGTNTIVIYIQDASGNIDSCLSTVTILDTIKPIVSCQNVTIQLDSNGQGAITLTDVNNMSNDNCSIQQLYLSGNTSFNCANIGNGNTVYLVGIDASGNIDSCQSIITIQDNIQPTFNCPGNIFDTLINICDYQVPDFTNLITSINDNCTTFGGYSVTQTPAAGSIIDSRSIPKSTVSLFVTDANNNTNQCDIELNIHCLDEINIPHFISPNNDGYNDTWVIKNIQLYPNSSVIIYNRWGREVYSKQNGYDNSWGGETKEAEFSGGKDQILPSGTYFFTLDLGLNKSTTHKGYIQIRK